MTTKKINFLNFATIVGLSLIVFSGSAFGVPQGIQGFSRKNDTTGKEILINPIESDDYLGDKIVSFGMQLLGTPYVTAASGKKGFDCSGFVYFVFQHFKIKVPRSSSEFTNFGKEIPISSVKKGDILLFLSPTRNVIGHIGIVTNPKGMESDFIHASSGREMKVIITSLKKPGYTRRFVKAVRVL